MKTLKNNNSLSSLIKQIRTLVEGAREKIARNINNEILLTYWQIGKHIVEYEQKGEIKAEYGKQLLINLSKKLTIELGRGFSRSNLQNMRLFFINYNNFNTSLKPIRQTASGKLNMVEIGEIVSHQLSWSHYCELLQMKVQEILDKE